MIPKTAKAIVGAVVAMSWAASAAMAEQAGAANSQEMFKGPLKVFILAGQSNMEGHAGVQTLDQLGEHPTHGHLLKKIKKADGSFVVRDDVFVSANLIDMFATGIATIREVPGFTAWSVTVWQRQ